MSPRRAKIAALLSIALAAIGVETACNEILGNSDGQFVPDAGKSADANDEDVARADGGMTATDAGDGGGFTFDASPNEGGPNGFCASISPAPAFCADFDEADSDGGLYGFATETPGTGCSLTRDTTNTSPPLALRALVTNVAGCYLSTTVVPQKSIAIDFDLRMHALPGSPAGPDAVFALHVGNVKYVLYAGKGGIFIESNNGTQSSNSDSLPAPTLDVYKHFQMALQISTGTNPLISAKYDQTTITFGGKTQPATLGPFEPNSSAEVRIGLPELIFSNVGDVYIDNVVVTVQ
jgi:hypothetical protein